MTDKDPSITLINDAITRLLARREHSRHELLLKLAQKGLDAQLCRQQLDLYSDNDVQSEQRYADMLVRSRVSKGIGEQRIRGELRQHEIDSGVVEQVLAQLQIDWFALAKQTALAKFAHLWPMDWQQQQKSQRFLHYRGFNSEQIRYALEELKNEENY